MFVLIIGILMVLVILGAIVFDNLIQPALEKRKQHAIEATHFVKFNDRVSGGRSFKLYNRLKAIWEATDNDQVRHGMTMIVTNHLNPAVDLYFKYRDEDALKTQLDLIEANVANAERGFKALGTIELNTFTAYLRSINEGVIHMPSELDLSGIDYAKIQAAYKPRAIEAKPSLTAEEKSQLDHYEAMIRANRKEEKDCLGYAGLVRNAQEQQRKYENLAAPLRKKAGK
jgi:hypothetical protein